eukprot:m.50652 g.50652  ORF g.50652 m.50652 type:complete len:63 (+) comp18063_c0_seq1:1173-1361(+)
MEIDNLAYDIGTPSPTVSLLLFPFSLFLPSFFLVGIVEDKEREKACRCACRYTTNISRVLYV